MQEPQEIVLFYSYKIVNLLNDKLYYGKTNNPTKRWSAHKRLVGKKNHPLYNAMKKYGINNFEFVIIDEYLSEQECFDAEIKLIAESNKDNLYNIALGGQGLSGLHLSDETKNKISLKNKGKKRSEQTKNIIRENTFKQFKNNGHPRCGRKHTDLSKEKQRNAKLGKKKGPLSQETKDKLSKANKGKIRTLAVRQKLSELNSGKILSEETKKKISLANTGRKVSDETKRKISIKHSGKKCSEQTIQKIKFNSNNRSVETKEKILLKNRENGKLTIENVRIIKQLLSEKTLLQREIALMFGVSKSSISDISKGATWKEI